MNATRRRARLFVLHPIPSRANIIAVAVLLPAFMAAFRLAEPEPAPFSAGLLLLALGLTIRVVTNSVLRKNQEICRDGLYAFCRHPMYVGSIMLAAGIALVLNHWSGLVLVAAVIGISIYRIRKEEAFLEANLPGYARYRDEVPAFPTLASMVRGFQSGRLRQRLSLRQCFLNGEIFRLNLYLPLIVVCGLYLRQYDGLPLPGGVMVAGALVALLTSMASMRWHPADSPRNRLDYVLPAGLSAAALILAVAQV